VRLLAVRHAIAEEREIFAATGGSEDLRPLTDRGRERMQEGARGLVRLVSRLTVLATSPYTRAEETAGILSAAFGGIEPEPLDLLRPEGDFRALSDWLRGLARNDTVAIVGHEPHLSGFVCYLLTGRDGPFLELKKGGACLLELSDPVRPGAAVLRWSLAPNHLRKIGRLPAGPA
jgi:phosphohistidine phosphatase